MCIYEQLHFACGHVKWGILTQRCQREVDDPSSCDVRTVGPTLGVVINCELCGDIRLQKQRGVTSPRAGSRKHYYLDGTLGDKAQISKKDDLRSLVGLQASPTKRVTPDRDFKQEGEFMTSSHGSQPGGAGPSSPVKSNPEIPEGCPDLNPDRRFLEPHKYFSELESIEAAVVERSALHLFEGHHRASYHTLSPSAQNNDLHIKIKFIPSDVPTWNSLDEVVKEVFDGLSGSETSIVDPACQSSVLSRAEAQYLLFHLCECRNLLVRVYQNLKSLRKEGFGTGQFSMLISSPTRPEVVELVEWNSHDVFQLADCFDQALHQLTMVCRPEPGSLVGQVPNFLNSPLRQFLKLSPPGLWSSLTAVEPWSSETAVVIWRTVVHSLDPAVVSYCGAHIENFDQRYLGYKLHTFEIYSTFFKGLGPGPTLQRRTLKCLDGFLEGEQVWVLHTHGPPPERLASQPLYLRTTIEAFADVWGPVWKTNPINQPKIVTRFNAGLGFIVPWSRPVDTEPAPLSDEINCHWTADEDVIPSVDGSILDTPYKNYLIGGAAPSVTTNTACPVSAELKTYHMQCNGYLRPFGTCGSSKYRDSETIQVQISSFGIGAGYQRQYKRRSKVTWKAQLVEAWKMEPDRRTPEVLETWSGLEVSACSSNARRRRLIRVLHSDTMRNYLGNCYFEWSDDKCERAYFDALGSENPRAFYELYRNRKEWRKDLGRAVSWCLEKLLNTGVDGDGYLVSFRCIEPRQESMAVLNPIEHTWIGFLADTPEKGTFAVSAEVCLEFRFAGGLGCRDLGQKGYTVLETALEINPDAEKPKNLSPRVRIKSDGVDTVLRWSVSRLEEGNLFPVGLDGYLRVDQPLAQGQLLMSWERRSSWEFKEARDTLNQRVLKRPPSRYHWEHFHVSSGVTYPIRIHIMLRNPINRAPQTTSIAGREHERDDAHSLQPEPPSRRHERQHLPLSARRARE